MIKKIYRKITSQRGASLSFAMMLLLVAAVVGAVLLHAATAAAGRVSQLAVADARYYSVSSAADIIEKELNNFKVSIVREETKQWSESTTVTENTYNVVIIGNTEATEPIYHYTSYFEDRSNIARGRSLTLDWAIDKILGENCVNFTGYDIGVWNRNKYNGSRLTYRYSFEHEFDEEQAEAVNVLDVKMDVEMQENGNLYILLYNFDEGSNERYRVQLTYSAEVKENNVVTESVRITIDPQPGSVKGVLPYTVDEIKDHTMVTTKTSSICWTLIDRKELSYD